MIAEARRFNVVACGRRWGKSTLGINRVIKRAVSGVPVAWCSPTYPMLTDIWSALKLSVRPVTFDVSETEHRIRLVTRGTIDLWSLDNPDTILGRAYACLVIDEAATVKRLPYAWEQVLRPTLTDYRGDAWFLSTPKGLNYFHTLYLRGADVTQQDWAAWRFPSRDNPYLAQDEIDAARRDLPERAFKQEYEAEFLETEGAVFRRVLDAVRTVALPDVRQPQYVIGIDWARLSDFTVYCVVEATSRSVVTLDRFNEIDYAVQLQRLRVLCQKYPPMRVVAERNAAGDPLIEQLRRVGIPVWPFITTALSKRTIIESLQLAFEEGTISIPNDATLVGELLSYTAERLPSGVIRYEAPSGQHDDTVMALAIAWSAVGSPAQTEFLSKAYRW